MSVEVAQLHSEIEALVEKFDVVAKIQEIEKAGDVLSSG
jgi:hypothetical protein